MPPGIKFFFSWVFPLIFVAVGASLAVFGVRGLLRARDSVAWPSVQGRIVESSVERHHRSGSKGGSSSTYHAEILYEFAVDGTTYNGTRVAYGDYGSSNPSHARRIVNRYPAGKNVAVYHLPGNPEECLLEPGVKGQAWVLPGIGLIFFGAGILMTVFLPIALRKKAAAAPGIEEGAAGSAV